MKKFLLYLFILTFKSQPGTLGAVNVTRIQCLFFSNLFNESF